MEPEELEKIWVCRICLHKFVPFRNDYTCPECHSESTFSTKNDSKIKKSETHTDTVPSDPYLIISDETVIEDADLKSIYERCLSWLQGKDAEIGIERPPTHLSAIHFPGGVHITEYQKEIHIKLTPIEDGVRLVVDMWRLIDPRLIMYTRVGWRSNFRRIHRDKLVEIARYRESWAILLNDLYRHLGIKQ